MQNRALITVLALVGTLGTAVADGAPAKPANYAIKDVVVYVTPTRKLEGVTVTITNGVITDIAKNASVGTGVTAIEGKGMVITTGLVDASTSLGLVEVAAEADSNDGDFSADKVDPVHAAYRVTDGYNAQSVAIPVARSGGVTRVVTAPDGGLISGTSALFKLLGRHAGEATVKAPLAMYASLGRRALQHSHGSRGKAIEALREILSYANIYSRMKSAFESNRSRTMAADRLDLEALIPVIKGTLPLVVRADRASDVLAAIALGKEFGARIIIEGGVEAWVVAKELAAAKVPVILDPLRNLPRNFDTLQVRDDAATVLVAAGVKIAISTLGSAANVRRLRQLAGNAVANGLSPDAALAAITTAPLEIFGVATADQQVQVNNKATLVIWSGDPFELISRPLHVFIDGDEVSLESRQTALRRRYSNSKSDLDSDDINPWN